jgi:excisionase family DNA binding protein
MADIYSGVNMEMDSTGHNGHSEDEAFYTLKEAAALLRIAERTLRRLLHDKKIHGYRVGRQWRIPKALIDRMRTVEDSDLPNGEARDRTRDFPDPPFGESK